MVSEWNSVYKKKGGVSNSSLQRNQKMRELRRFWDYGEAILHVIDTFPPGSMVETPPSFGATGGMRGGRGAQFMIFKEKGQAQNRASPQ